ncbi:hypothetical protein Tco_1330238 [Tanacetum coccineum]
MMNLEDNFTFGDQFFIDKYPEDEQGKANVDTKVESMVTVPIQQAYSSAPTLSTHVIDLSPPKPKKICANFEKRHKLQNKTIQALSSRVFTLENHDLYSKIYNYVNETVKESVHNALQAPVPLYEALESSIDHENREEFLEAIAKSQKRCYDDQDLPLPLPKDSDQSKKKRHDSDASASQQPLIKTRPDWLKPIPEEDTPDELEPDWVIPPNNLPEPENNWANSIAKTCKDPEENKLIQKTRDMGSFIKWYCNRLGKSKLVKGDLEGQAYKLIRPFHKNNISLQFQMEECQLLLTD